MWREIRGKGLAYNYRLSLLVSEGTITLKLNKAAQLVSAYRETLKLLVSRESWLHNSLKVYCHRF